MTLPENTLLPGCEIRKQLAACCRNKEMRTAKFSRTAPTDWKPFAVTDPETGRGFTEHKAWNFIADLLMGDYEVSIITLSMPPNKKGYVIKTTLSDGKLVYIKLQLSNKVVGRSFHYSYRDGQ